MTGIAVVRAMLLTVAIALGGFGVFFLSYSAGSDAPADYAVTLLAMASLTAWFVDKSAEHD